MIRIVRSDIIVLTIFYVIELVSVRRRRIQLRIKRAFPRVFEILCRYWIPVGPFCIVAQMESIFFAIIGYIPFLCNARYDVLLFIHTHQTLEQTRKNRKGHLVLCLRDVETWRFGR